MTLMERDGVWYIITPNFTYGPYSTVDEARGQMELLMTGV